MLKLYTCPITVKDTHGKGHISRHPAEGQTNILMMLLDGLDVPAE